MTHLDLSGNVAISSNGWCAFSRVLSCPTGVIKSLDLRNTQMDSEVIACLGQSWAINTVLHDLYICNNPSITASGWRCFLGCLRSPDAALKVLKISRCNINNESAAVIATGLTQNSSLKDLDMAWNESITLAGWKSFFNTMLNWKHCCSLEKLTMTLPSDDNSLEELGENLCHHLCDKSSTTVSIHQTTHCNAFGIDCLRN